MSEILEIKKSVANLAVVVVMMIITAIILCRCNSDDKSQMESKRKYDHKCIEKLKDEVDSIKFKLEKLRN